MTRAQVAALGGNALLSYRLNECVLIEHPHKNQVILTVAAQTLIHYDVMRVKVSTNGEILYYTIEGNCSAKCKV